MTRRDINKTRMTGTEAPKTPDTITVEEQPRRQTARGGIRGIEPIDSGYVTRIDLEALFGSMSFKKDTVEEYISHVLANKIRKPEANLVAIELGHLICSSAYSNGATIEERALNREVGLRLMELIALAYFNSVNEVEAFMLRINGFAKFDIILETGCFEERGQAYESCRPAPGNSERKQDDAGRGDDTTGTTKAREKKATPAIGDAAALMGDELIDEKLQQVLDRFSAVRYAIKVGASVEDMEWLFDIKDRLFS